MKTHSLKSIRPISTALRKTGIALSVCAAALVTACATAYDVDYGYKEGWRRGQVVEVGDGQTAFKVTGTDCRPEMGDKANSRRFALVSYSYGGNPKLRLKRTTVVPDDLLVAKGEWVYLNIRDCTLPLKRVASSGSEASGR